MMQRIGRAYRAEVTKALRRKFTYAGPALLIVAVACMPLVHPVGHGGASAYAFIAYATPTALNLLGFVVLVTYCASLVSTELQSGTICMVLVRPVRRHEFILAKLLLGMSYAVALTVTVAAATWLIALGFGDLTGVTYGGEVLYTTFEMQQAYLAGMALGLLPQFAAAAYAVMLSTLTSSTGTALGSAVGIWIAVDLVKHPLRIAPCLFSSYLESPWQVFAGRCDGLDPQWLPDTLYAAGASVGALLLFTAVAIMALARRNLHV